MEIFPSELPLHPLSGMQHEHDFAEQVVASGAQPSSYFEKSGLRQMALEHDGMCGFWMGDTPAIYIAENEILIDDEALTPPGIALDEFFGNFMLTQNLDAPKRQEKRHSIAKVNGEKYLQQITPELIRLANDYVSRHLQQDLDLQDFVSCLVAYVDSHIPGFLDFKQMPLSSYYHSEKHAQVMQNFIDAVSEAGSKVNSERALKVTESICPFMRDVLLDNYDSILQAPERNLIRKWFAVMDIPFTRESIENLDDSLLKELGVTTLGAFDTTALNLIWVVCFIEAQPDVKAMVIEDAHNDYGINSISLVDKVILETLRMHGPVPDAAFRVLTRDADLDVNGHTITVKKGTMLWFDKAQGNRNKGLYCDPRHFNLANIDSVIRPGDGIFQLLSNQRYEINTFSSVPTRSNQRKCPGRFFSMIIQRVLIRELYGKYKISSSGVTTDVMPFKAMQRPNNAAKLTIVAGNVS